MSGKRNITLLYAMAILQSLIPAYVIERLFWAERGLGVGVVVACEIIYALTVLLLEVPSGVLADTLGRKTLLCVGTLTSFLEFLLLLNAWSAWQAGLAVFLTGIGKACASGTENAMLYDSLAVMGETGQFEKAVARLRALEAVSTIIAGLAGGLTAQWFGLSFNYQLSLVSCALAFVCSLLLHEPVRVFPKEEGETPVRVVLRQAKQFFLREPLALRVFINATVMAGLVIYVDEFWQLYLDAAGHPASIFGVVLLLFTLLRMAGASLGGRLADKWRADRLLLLLSAVLSGGLVLAALTRNLLGLAAMMLACATSEVMQVIATGYLHRRADDAARATIESLASMMERVSVIGMGLLFAAVAERRDIFSAFGVLAIVAAALAGLFVLLHVRRNRTVG